MKTDQTDDTDLTRRRLLLAAAVLAAGARWPALAGATESDAAAGAFLPAGSAQGQDVLVLGVGIAGLVTAYELHRAGCRVRVLEARERVGGCCWTLRRGDRFIELGGAEQECRFAPGDYLNAAANPSRRAAGWRGAGRASGRSAAPPRGRPPPVLPAAPTRPRHWSPAPASLSRHGPRRSDVAPGHGPRDSGIPAALLCPTGFLVGVGLRPTDERRRSAKPDRIGVDRRNCYGSRRLITTDRAR